jgi:hypothetical protein
VRDWPATLLPAEGGRCAVEAAGAAAADGAGGTSKGAAGAEGAAEDAEGAAAAGGGALAGAFGPGAAQPASSAAARTMAPTAGWPGKLGVIERAVMKVSLSGGAVPKECCAADAYFSVILKFATP